MMTSRERQIFKVKRREVKPRFAMKPGHLALVVLFVAATSTSAPVLIRLHQVFAVQEPAQNDYYCQLIRDGASTVDMDEGALADLCAKWGVNI